LDGLNHITETTRQTYRQADRQTKTYIDVERVRECGECSESREREKNDPLGAIMWWEEKGTVLSDDVTGYCSYTLYNCVILQLHCQNNKYLFSYCFVFRLWVAIIDCNVLTD